MLNSPTTWGQHQHQQNAAAALGPASSSPYFSIALYAAGRLMLVLMFLPGNQWFGWLVDACLSSKSHQRRLGCETRCCSDWYVQHTAKKCIHQGQ